MKKIFCVIIALVFTFGLASCSAKNFDWNDMILGNMLPEPPSRKGETHYNTADQLWLDAEKISDKDFTEYIESCKAKGFNIDIKSNSSSFDAYNSEGYKLSLSHSDYDKKMTINLNTPMEMSTITWPGGIAGAQIPAPKSTIGNFSYEYDDNFYLYVGNTAKTEYIEYVNACSEKGFNVDYNKGDDYYYAKNNEGWSLSLRYEGYNIMSIHIDAPDNKADIPTTNNSENSQIDSFIDSYINPFVDSSYETAAPKTTENKTKKDITDNGVLSPDFKKAMDSYEEFMNEYVEFMKKYQDDPENIELLTDYASFMSKYAEFEEDFEKWETEEMNTAETAYYLAVQSRVSKKLLEVAY